MVNSAGLQASDALHSERQHSLTHVKFAKLYKSDSFTDRSEILNRSHTTQNKDGKKPKTSHLDGLHTLDEFYAQNFKECSSLDGTRDFNPFLQTALYVFTVQISMILKIGRIYHRVVVLTAFLSQAAGSDTIALNCTGTAVVTSQLYPNNYPEYQSTDQYITAPEGRMILLHFDDFSLASPDVLEIRDIVQPSNGREYKGQDNTFPAFLSRGNQVLLRFRTYESLNGKGFKISASCYQLSEIRVGRLVDGNTPSEGFLELQAETDGTWRKVCADPLPHRVAEVICGELGFPGVKEVSYQPGECHSYGSGWNCIQPPSCRNSAYRSQDCLPSFRNCTSSVAVKVNCFEPGYTGCFNFQEVQLQKRSIYNTTSQCISSCRANTSQTIAITNGSSCVCSTSGLSGFTATPEVDRSCFQQANRSATYQAVYDASVGFCNNTDDVMNGSWDSNITWFGSVVHLKCDDGYTLNGTRTLQCVPGESPLVPVWNNPPPTCEKDEDKDIISPTNFTRPSSLAPDYSSPGMAVGISIPVIIATTVFCIVGVSI